MCKLACACSNDSNQSAQYDQSLSFLPEETLDSWLLVELKLKVLIRVWDPILIDLFQFYKNQYSNIEYISLCLYFGQSWLKAETLR